jgi:AraC-like DNA-binding protein
VQSTSRPSESYGRGRRDQRLEGLVSRVQLLAAQFDRLEEHEVREHCTGILEALPVFRVPATRAIASVLLLDLIARIAISKHSPPDMQLLFSAVRLCSRLDVPGLSAVLASWRSRTAAELAHAGGTATDARVERAIDLISMSHTDISLTLSSVAEDVHLSPWHLSRLLVHYTASSFKARLEDTRLRHATNLLQETFLTIKEIAHQCGYQQVETFERAFKRRFGCPPTHWRKSHPSSMKQETSENGND